MSLVNCLQRANKGKRVFTSAEIQELTRLAAQSDAASAVQKLLDEAIAEQAEVRSLILEAAPALGEKAEVKPVEAKAEAKPEAAPAPSEEVAAVEPAPVEEAKPEGVQNFGEVLPPSRRQKIAALDASLSDDDIEKRPLSEIWPLSANEAIEDKFAAAVAHAARESVPTKPRKGYKLDRWVQAVKTVRELSKLVVSGGVTPEQFKAKAGSSYAMEGFVSKVGLLNAIDRAQWKRIGTVREMPKASMIVDGKSVIKPMVAVEVDGKNHWLEGSGSVADHLDKINELLGEAPQDKKMAFEVRGSGTKFFINKKGDSEYRHLMEFTTAEEAIKAKREKYDDLVKAWDAVKDRDNVTERDLRSDENKDRIGKDWRDGKDISGDEFDAKFGFKGGEFGKWVSQGTGARERQWMLNRAYDALMDLAEIVGVPPRAISLNGTMGIAFGSRGSGWASAHFEPGNLVINLTKTRGAGALGHEWFHALDNYFSRMRRGGSEAAFNGNQKDYRDNNFITHHPEPMMVGKGPGYRTPMTRADLERRRAQNPNAGYFKAENWQVDPIHPDGVRPEVEERFADLVKALNEAPMTKRAAMIDKGTGYWSQMLERAARSFESYLLLRMQEKGQSNDYLANVTKFQDFKRDKGRYPYPTPDEIKPVADAFDALFAEVKTREDDAGNVAMFSRNANTRLGIPMKDATAVAQAIREALPTAPQIIVHESLAQAPQKLQDAINAAGAANDVEAAYHDGAIHVFPQHMASVERMAFVVGHHEIRHHGLRSMLGPRLGPVLLGMHQGNAGLREAAQAKIDAGLATSRVDAIEEALADMPAEDLAALTGWDKIVTAVRQWLRNLAAKLRRTMPNLADAIDPEVWTDRDVAAMVMRAENVSRGGSGAFRTGGTVFSQDSDKPLTEAQFYRTYLQHKDIRGQRAGTAAQNAEAIMRDGFKSQAGAINVMPAYRGGQPINVAERAYAPRAGDTVYLVPRDAMDGDKVKTGWKPKPYEVLTITEDYASLYQEYLRAREEGGSGTMFSRTTAGTAKLTAQRETVKAVRQTIGDIFGSAGAKVSWWDKTLGTQYAKAQKFPTFKRVFDQVQQYLEDVSSLANEAADNAPSILPKLETWKDLKRMGLSDADATAIAAPIFTGTLTDEKVYSDAELKSQHKLNDAQIKLYREFMATVNTSLDQVVAADVVRLLGDKNPALQELAITDRAALREGVDAFLTDQIEQATDDPENQQALTELRESIREKYTKVDNLKAKGYAPLMRFGKYAVNVADPATGESLFFGLYESRGAANRMTRELGEDPQFKGKEITQGVLSAEQYKLFQAVPMESLEMFANAIGAEQSAVFQEYLKLAKNNRSALKRLIKRKGTAGFSEDVPRVLAAFTTSNARLASGAMNWTKAKEAIQDIRDGDIKDEAIKLVDEVQNPGERASLFRSMMFANFIGGSVASALVNVTQPITMTLPYLSQFGGLTKAGARLMAAGKMAASGRIDDLALKVALKRAEADGIVSPQEIHHLTSQAMGTWGTNPYLQKAAFIWGAPFSLAEQFNRRVTFIAAYQTAKAEGIDDPFGFAEKSVTETQGLYNKGNAPNLTRSAIGASALTFKQFSIHYLEWMGRMWKSGPEGKKAVGIALALLILAAGTDGLPGADDLDDLIDTLAQSMGYDLNVKRARREFVANTLGMGDEGADVLARGLSAMAGVPMDLSLRMSMGNLLPGTGILLRSNTDKSASLLEVAGPLGGLTKQYLEASQAALRGDVGSAIEKAAPVAIQNAIKGASMWATGEARDTKGAKVMEADGLDAAVKIVGFNPSSIARESQKLGMIRRSEQLAKNVEGEIAAAWARAIVDKDADGIAEARQQLADWNENNPEARIKITMQQLVQRAKKLRETRAQRFITSTSPERRRAVAEEIQ